MENLLKIRLRALSFELKHDREYMIRLGKDLFQQWYVTITFGRFNAWGTSKTKTFDTQEEAYSHINSMLRRRLSSIKRIGCAYQLVAFDGAEEILATMSQKVIERFSWFTQR
jgi:predicted DNA-binding WGR domain protein